MPREFYHLAEADSFWLAEVFRGWADTAPSPGGRLPGLHPHGCPRRVGMCEHPHWMPRAHNKSPFITGRGRASQHSQPGDSVTPTCESAPSFCSWGRRPLWLHPLRLRGCSHQSSRPLLALLDTGSVNTLLMEREVRAKAGGWHTPAQLTAPSNPARGTKGRRKCLTFRGSPLFGLQR